MRALVIEDSRLARQGLVRMLRKFKAISVVGEAENPSEARELIEIEKPDLLFLDIHMPGETGFDLLASLDYMPKIIFTTAYADYAVQSFEHNTVDYLLKPISEERLAAAIKKLDVSVENVLEPNHCDSQIGEIPTSVLSPRSQIFIKDGDHCHLIKVSDILYIESCKNYVQLFFKGQKAFVKKSLNQVEERLPKDVFFRASRQFVVNFQCIANITENLADGYDLTMSDGTMIEVSRRNAAKLKQFLSL